VAKTGADAPDAALERELAGLRNEYEKLREEKVRAEQTLEHLKAELAALEEEAGKRYGTSDPGELKAMLAAMRAENERQVRAYREHVAAVREGLAALERGADAQ
jgi:chromosome segregation ATPase